MTCLDCAHKMGVFPYSNEEEKHILMCSVRHLNHLSVGLTDVGPLVRQCILGLGGAHSRTSCFP